MSVDTLVTQVQYTATGSSPLAVPFVFFAATDLAVTGATGTALPFTVGGVPSAGTGTVTLVTPVTSQVITIKRTTPLTQPAHFGLQGVFSPKAHEAGFDRATTQIQDLSRDTVANLAAEVAARLAADQAEAATRLAGDQAEAAARAAADAAIIASGAEPANVGLAPVIASNSTQARTVADRFGEVVNVKDFGAIGNGTIDDTIAIQAAVDAAKSRGGGTVFFPTGTYKVSDTISAQEVRGLWLVGNGQRAVILQPTTALAGKPVLLFTDCRGGGVEKLAIYGYSGAVPDCAIQFDTLSTRHDTPMYMTVRDVEIGSASGNSIQNGVRITASDDYDANNEQHLFDNVEINNIVDAGISIEHSNSLLHTIRHCSFNNCNGTAVRVGGSGASPGGSFKMYGCLVVSGPYVAILRGSAYYNPIIINGCTAESVNYFIDCEGAFSVYIRDSSYVGSTSSSAEVAFRYVGANFNGNPGSGIFMIDGGTYFANNGYTIDTSESLGTQSLTVIQNCGNNATRIKFTGMLLVGPNAKAVNTYLTKTNPTDMLIDLGGATTVEATGRGSLQVLPNNVGTFTVSDTLNYAVITFARAEPQSAGGAYDYMVLASSAGGAGTPDPAAYTISAVGSKTATSCRVYVLAAPGAGSSVTFTYKIVRADPT